MRPNERFSGGNHGRHLCRDCSKHSKEELELQSAVRNIDRMVLWPGRVRRKQRRAFERFLQHPNPRVREYAAWIQAPGPPWALHPGAPDTQAAAAMGEEGDLRDAADADAADADAADADAADTEQPADLDDIPF